MSFEKSVLGIVPGLQATALLGGTMSRRGKAKGRMIRKATDIFVGVPLISASSNVIAGL